MKKTLDLSISLAQAIHNPAHRPQFYHDFYDATVFLVSHSDDSLQHSTQIDWHHSQNELPVQQIQIHNDWYVPVFSSLKNMLAHIEKPVYYLSFPAKELLLILDNMHWYLDYGCPISKPFHADELAAIANGSIQCHAKETIINQDAEVLLGEPTEYPSALAELLLSWLPTQPAIKRAWLAMIFNPSDGLPPHTILAIDGDQHANMALLSHTIGQLIQSKPIPNPPLDILPLGNNEAIENYFLVDTQPFYQAN